MKACPRCGAPTARTDELEMRLEFRGVARQERYRVIEVERGCIACFGPVFLIREDEAAKGVVREAVRLAADDIALRRSAQESLL